MLMNLRIDVRCDQSTIRRRFPICGGVDLEDTSQSNLKLNAAILVEKVVPDILYNRSQYVDDYSELYRVP